MVNITINGIKTSVQEGTTIMAAAKTVGIEIPHICFWEGLNEIGACRICVVELEGKDKLVSSCNTVAEEGMVVYTNSPRVRQARQVNIQLLLAEPATETATAPCRTSPEIWALLTTAMKTQPTSSAGTRHSP